jgi:HK97 gp10 family phage protein
MSDDIRLDLDDGAIADLISDSDAVELMQEVGNVVAENAAEDAPKLSGAGAASIFAQTGVDDQSAYADISWDQDHYYMGFRELGTEHEGARPFLRPALDRTAV